MNGLPEYDVTLHITHNQHKCYYESAEEYLNRPAGIGCNGFDAEQWIDRADYDAAIANDSIWEVQWYPRTPVGSFTVYGSTLKKALAAANPEHPTI